MYALRGGSYDLIARHEEGIVVWLLLEVGFAFGLLPRARLPRLLWVPLIALGALAALTALSVIWTESDGRTVDELTRVAHYGGIVLLAVSALNRFTWRAAAAGLSAAALLICGFAIASRLDPGTLPDEVAAVFDSNRLSYPLDYWNATAAWGAMSLAAALAWSAHARQPLLRAAALAAAPVASLAVYLSYSRAGVVGVAVGTICVLALSRNRWTASAHTLLAAGAGAVVILIARGQPQIADGAGSEGAGVVLVGLLAAAFGCGLAALAIAAAGMDRIRLPGNLARAAVAAGAVVALLALTTAGRAPISDAWDEFQNQDTVAVGDDPASRLENVGGKRADVWEAALAAFEAEPVGGIGPGTFEFWWSRTGENPEFARDAHSLYFEQLAELGLPGLLLTVAFLGGLAAVGLRARVAAKRTVDAGASAAMLSVFAVFLVHAGLDWMWELTAVSALGIGAGCVAASAASSRSGAPLAPWPRFGLVGLALVAILIQIPGLVSTARVRESEATLAGGDPTRAQELAAEAVEAEPWASEPYIQRATVADVQGRLDDARADLLEAIDREPTNWRPWILLAQVELQRKDEEASRAAFDEARRLHPTSRLYVNFSLFKLEILSPEKLPPEFPVPEPIGP